MNRFHKRRLYYVVFAMIGLAIAVGLILTAFKNNLNAFLTPTQALARHTMHTIDRPFYLGGLVKKGSVQRSTKGLMLQFVVTDFHHDICVQYAGVLPDLFREGKGAIAFGNFNSQGMFVATTILAKHDENYQPLSREVH